MRVTFIFLSYPLNITFLNLLRSEKRNGLQEYIKPFLISGHVLNHLRFYSFRRFHSFYSFRTSCKERTSRWSYEVIKRARSPGWFHFGWNGCATCRCGGKIIKTERDNFAAFRRYTSVSHSRYSVASAILKKGTAFLHIFLVGVHVLCYH